MISILFFLLLFGFGCGVAGYAMGRHPTIAYSQCYIEQVDKQVDQESGKTVWITRCINERFQRDVVVFEQEVFRGDFIEYIPFSENDDTFMHGYIHSIDDKKRIHDKA